MAKYDWDKLKAKYVGGNYKNLREFAEKENINYDVLRRKASKWQNEKSQASHKKVTKIVTKTIEKIAEKEADRNARHIALLDLILDKTEKVISEELTTHVDMFGNAHKGEIIEVAKLESMARVLEKAQKGHRLALGLDKDIERERLEIERRKLLIAETKDKVPDNPSVKPYIDALKGTMSEVWDDEADQ